jgi:hypothetical protein
VKLIVYLLENRKNQTGMVNFLTDLDLTRITNAIDLGDLLHGCHLAPQPFTLLDDVYGLLHAYVKLLSL